MYKNLLILFSNVIIYGSSLTGLTLFSVGTESYLLNNDLDQIYKWNHTQSTVGTSYLIPDRTILVQLRCEHSFGFSHGPIGGRFQKINFDEEVIWDFSYFTDEYHPHHDFEPLPNGNILIIAWEKKTQVEQEEAGRVNTNNEFWPLKIVELMPIGYDSSTVVWEWHLWDHLIQDVYPNLDNYGDISSNPQLLDVNLVEINNPNNGDWLHTNAIDYNVQLDQIAFSSRFLDEIFIIDHSTTTFEASTHSGGNSGKGGDFLYRWGNPQNYDRGDEEDKILNDQHGVNWIDDSYVGEGNLLIFNNNPSDPTGQDHSIGNSSIIEIIPPLFEGYNYEIDVMNPYLPEMPTWNYGGDSSFYSHFQSGSYRLKNGNTFTTVSQDKYIFEIDSENEVVLEYFLDSNEVTNGNIARAQKYNYDYFYKISGDIDSNFKVNVVDLVQLQDFIENNEYDNDADFNNDGFVDLLDSNFIINLILNVN